MSKFMEGEDTYSTPGKVDDIFVLSADITYVFPVVHVPIFDFSILNIV